MIQITKFAGLEKAAKDFVPFNVLEAKEDPYFPGVFLLHIFFTEERSKSVMNKHGLCIYDTNKQKFIEEPGDLDDFGDTPEKLQKQHGFTQWK